MNKGAFTLLELLVVIGIIAILAALAIPATQRVIQSGLATSCLSNLRQLGVGLNLYLGEHNQTMPVLLAGRADKSQDVPVIDNTLNRYLPDPKVFACPADARDFAAHTGTSYYWNNALNGQAIANLSFMNNTLFSAIPIMSDKEGFHPYIDSKINVLNADGHVTKGLHFNTNP
ncbi:MAG: prepilin-type N-terminal cleavage/methylation domain-containing protein [Verrucomicrobiota bacterium]